MQTNINQQSELPLHDFNCIHSKLIFHSYFLLICSREDSTLEFPIKVSLPTETSNCEPRNCLVEDKLGPSAKNKTNPQITETPNWFVPIAFVLQQMCSSFCYSQISHFDGTQFIYYNCSTKRCRVVELGVQKNERTAFSSKQLWKLSCPTSHDIDRSWVWAKAIRLNHNEALRKGWKA